MGDDIFEEKDKNLYWNQKKITKIFNKNLYWNKINVKIETMWREFYYVL